MTLTVCLSCGQPSKATHCAGCSRARAHGDTTTRGYGASWQRLSRRARRLQPWCSTCGAVEDLTTDHLRWPATTLADVQVLCRGCNSRKSAGNLGTHPHTGSSAMTPQADFESGIG